MTVSTEKTGDEQQTSQVLFLFMAVFADMHLSENQLVLTNSIH